MAVGRPTECTPENVEIARDYLDNYELVHGHVVPSVAGLCKVLKLARSTLYVWADIEGNPFKDILEDVKEYQHFELTNKGLSGGTNSTITKLMLTKHGYSDKQDSTLANPDGQSFKTDHKWEVEFVNASPNSQ